MAEGTRWTQTLTGLSSTNGFPIWFTDVFNNPFSVGIGCVNSSAQTYNVEHTFDFDGGSPIAFISTAATWFPNSGITAQSSNANGNYAFPVTAIRLNVTAGTSTATVQVTVIQAGA